MQNIEYIKSYKEKELRQYVIAYLFVAVASVGFQMQITDDCVTSLATLFQMIIIDILIGAICIFSFCIK